MKNRIYTNHNLDEYFKKYKNLKSKLIKISKDEVENFDKKYGHYVFNKKTQSLDFNNYLLKNRKWWLIGDTYYEIPNPPTFAWFFNLNKVIRYSCEAVLIGGVACAIALPIILKQPSEMFSNIDKIHIVLSKNKSNIHNCSDARNCIKSELSIDIQNAKVDNPNYEYVFDNLAKEVVILNGDNLIYAPKSISYSLPEKHYLWKFVGAVDSNTEYSQYIKDNVQVGDIEVKSGLDVGNHNEIKSIHYTSSANKARDVVFRTFENNDVDSSVVNLTIRGFVDEDSSDHIEHYGNAANLYLVTNGMKSYHEFGEIKWAEVYEGALNLDKNLSVQGKENIGLIKNVQIKPTETGVVKLDNSKGGKIDNVLTTEEAIKTEIESQVPSVVVNKKTESEIKKDKFNEFKDNPEVQLGNIAVYDDLTSKLVNFYSSFAELKADTTQTTFENETVKLNTNYDMTEECSVAGGWVPICNDSETYVGAFAGTFDGQNHTISNFTTSTSMSGLFCSSRGNIKNLNFSNCVKNGTGTISGNAILVSLLCGNGSFDNIHFYNCKVLANGSSGFMVSWIDNSNDSNVGEHLFNNCTNDDKCIAYNTGGNQMGGLLGQSCYASKLEFRNCINNAAVSGRGAVGGIVGQYGAGTEVGIFDHCVNNGKITMLDQSAGGGVYAGGIVGYHNNASTTSNNSVTYIDCVNNGDVTVEQTDPRGRESTSVGGFCGYSNCMNVSFTRCINNGNIGLVEGEEGNYCCFKAAGFLAFNNGDYSETFTDCVNNGTIHASVGVGHFAALKQNNQKAINCSYTGKLVDENKRIIITGEN